MNCSHMFYLPPNPTWYLTPVRLTVRFDNGRTGTGTGFFILHEDNYFLTTVRHIVDPTYLPGAKRRLAKCILLELSFQCVVAPGSEAFEIGYQRIEVKEPNFAFGLDDVDLAIERVGQNFFPLKRGDRDVRPVSFGTEMIAEASGLMDCYAGEPVNFFGYPEHAPKNQVKTSEFHYPLLRQGVLAYPPGCGVPIEGALGSDYGLIDSFAQSGFSGGPVVTLQKGWDDGSWHSPDDHRPPALAGAICGHYRSSNDRSDGAHAGLSYFVRSTAILDLIASF